VIVALDDVPPCSGKHANDGVGDGDVIGEGLDVGSGEGEGLGDRIALGVGVT
jgi:hypothetical protein